MRLYLSIVVALAATGLVVTTDPLRAQTATPPRAADTRPFEVASIKPVERPAGPHGVSLEISHDRVNLNAATLRQIIGLAYSIQRVRVVGGPDWLDSEFYDIIAKAENPNASRAEILVMLQTLLADRFKLGVHRESKELTEYVLIVGKHGAKLKEASDKEKTGMAPGITPAGVRQISFYKMPISGLVNLLANQFGSPVLDQTGLKGLYDFKIDWPSASPGTQTTDAENPIQAAEPGIGLFDVLNEQLGLVLQSKKGAAEVLVVDHVQKASEN